MKAETKYFGEIDIQEEKVLDFPNGIVGFEDYHKFAIIHDIDRGEKVNVRFLQSMEEPLLVLPVINPLIVLEEYKPLVKEELLEPLGMEDEEDLLVLLAMSVPRDLTKMTVNMKAPFIINTRLKKGGQIIVENEDYQVRFPVYDILQAHKEKAGE